MKEERAPLACEAEAVVVEEGVELEELLMVLETTMEMGGMMVAGVTVGEGGAVVEVVVSVGVVEEVMVVETCIKNLLAITTKVVQKQYPLKDVGVVVGGEGAVGADASTVDRMRRQSREAVLELYVVFVWEKQWMPALLWLSVA